jgi:thioredoxin reductase
VVGGAVARLVVEGDRLTGVELVEGAVVARSAIFLRPGIAPHPDGLLAGLGCALDPAGFVPVDATGWTGVFGVWVAGNAADPRAQVITAAGAGSAAAIALNADLVLEDVERARGQHGPAGAVSSGVRPDVARQRSAPVHTPFG